MSELCWKIENDICRCCHGEGSFANLAVPQSIDGREEVYADMLRESLDINLVQVEGEMNNMTYTICGICIMRLRDAFMFKQQVLQCEDKFQEMYAKKFIQVSLPLKTSIKVELIDSDSADDEFILRDTDKDEDNDEIITTKIKQEKADAPEKKRLRPRKVAEKPKKAPMLKKMLTKKTQLKKKKKEEEEKKESEAEKNSVGAGGSADGPKCTITIERGVRMYRCNVCESIFKSSPLFSQHYKHVHLKMRPKLRSCFHCDVKVPGYMRSRHLEQAHGFPAPTCGACGKKFAYPFQVVRHQKFYHMGEKAFTCQYCDLGFMSQSKLNQHQIAHTEIRQYQCQYCEKAFKWKKNLTTHVMMHLNDKRQVCPICCEAFVQRTSLKYHMTKRHPEVIE